MSDSSTRRMISAYIEQSATPRQFLAGQFQSPPQNYHTTEDVEIDIQRNGEDIAVVVQDLSVGGRENEATVFTNKRFTPPIYDEHFTLNSFELVKRRPGNDPFQDIDFLATAFREFSNGMRRVEDKIRRGIELQAAQVLQTGKLTLTDKNGASLYALDFKPKTTHFATVGTAWGSGGATPLADIEALADVIAVDGKVEPTRLIFGRTAWQKFIADTNVVDRLKTFGMLGLQNLQMPQVNGAGGKFRGMINIGQYTFEIWTYAAWYKHPQTGAATYYVGDDKVIVMGDGRLDVSFGAIPRIVAPDPRLASINLDRVQNPAGGMDFTTNLWVSPDGRNLHGSVSARTLCIPTAIDTFGCLDVTP